MHIWTDFAPREPEERGAGDFCNKQAQSSESIWTPEMLSGNVQ